MESRDEQFSPVPIRREQKRLKSDVNYFNYNENKKSWSEKLVDDITR